jgi:hypothetical protein
MSCTETLQSIEEKPHDRCSIDSQQNISHDSRPLCADASANAQPHKAAKNSSGEVASGPMTRPQNVMGCCSVAFRQFAVEPPFFFLFEIGHQVFDKLRNRFKVHGLLCLIRLIEG